MSRTLGLACRCLRAGRLAGLVLGVLLLVASAPLAAGAAEDDTASAWGLEAVLGVGGHDVRGAWRPVTVTLTPEVGLRGRLLVAADRDGSRLVQSREVEVTAGTRKQWVLLAPPGSGVQVQVVEDGTGSAATVVPDRDQVDGFLVGVLGGLDPATVPRATVAPTDQRAVPVAIGDELLGLGPRALASVDTLVVRQADLVAMTSAHRGAIAQRVTTGAGLVVLAATDPDLGLPWRAATAHDGTTLEPAPGAWGTTWTELAGVGEVVDRLSSDPDVAAVAAGRGRVVVTTVDGASTGPLATAAAWEHLLQPAAGITTGTEEAAVGLPNRVETAFGSVVGDPPSVAWLAGFFVVYVVVVGPVLGVVLSRRRRPEVAWVVFPVVTALFAVAAFLGASGSRPQVGAGGQVAAWLDGVGTQIAVGGVRAPTGGSHQLVLTGTGWDVASASWTGTTRVEAGPDDTTIDLALPGQSFGAVVAERPAATPPPLDVEVALFAGEARVEVTNTGEVALGDLALRLATSTHDLAPTLSPGQTVVATVDLPDELPRQRDVFGDQLRGGPDGRPGADDLDVLVQWGLLDGAPGVAWVVGTAAGQVGPAVGSIDGAAPSQRGTLVAVGVTPPVTDDATTPFEVQRDLVAGTDQTWQSTPLTLTGTGPATLRFRLPAEGQVDGITFQLDRGCCADAPAPLPVPERCGQLEFRDEATGDLLRVEDHACNPGLPCPPEAALCEWGSDAGPVVEGRACYPDDRPCEQLRWMLDEQAPGPEDPFRPVGVSGLEAWDHAGRRWVDVAELGPDATTADPAPWLGPLGDVWVRVTGALEPFDLGPQGVTADLRGGT